MNNDIKYIKLSEQDIQLFRAVVGQVKPIKDTNRVVAESPRRKTVSRSAHRAVEAKYETKGRMPGQQGFGEMMECPEAVRGGDPLSYFQAGVQKKILKKLYRGLFPIGYELDMHGMTVEVVKKELYSAILSCKRRGIRAFKVIHGKGLRSVGHNPVLKNTVNACLRQSNDVLAFCSARLNDGGTGAVYVLVKRVG